jgi:hypothetical protein
MATEMSYNALNQGDFNVSKLRVSQQRSGFDLDIVNDDGSKTIIGVKASNHGKFYISSEELDALKKSSTDCNYIIHWYKFNGKKVAKFTAYKYDKELGMLVDMTDSSNVCYIREVLCDTNDAFPCPSIAIECLPKSIANDFEIKSSEFFGDMDYKKTARMISYNALTQDNASVEKHNQASWMKIAERIYSDFDPDSGFDIEVINGDGTKTIIGVNASPKSKFYIRPEELAAMKASNNECSYLIHRYKFSCGKVAKFYIYRYDPERNVLVDIVDPRNTCAIKEMDYCDAWWERTFEAVECTPKRKLFTFTKED